MPDNLNPNQNYNRINSENQSTNPNEGINNPSSLNNNLEQRGFPTVPETKIEPSFPEKQPPQSFQSTTDSQLLNKAMVPVTSVPVQIEQKEPQTISVITGEGAAQRLAQIIENYALKEDYFTATEEYNKLRNLLNKPSENQPKTE